MNTLTNKQIRELMSEFSPNPGFVLNLSRAKFEELIEDVLDIDISEMKESNGKRLKHLFKTLPNKQINILLTLLRKS